MERARQSPRKAQFAFDRVYTDHQLTENRTETFPKVHCIPLNRHINPIHTFLGVNLIAYKGTYF